MIRGLEDFADCKFEYTEQYKEAILSVLDNELEVFDPICDGDVEIAEGIAYVREYVDSSILKADDYDVIKTLCDDALFCGMSGRFFTLSEKQEEGYKEGVKLVGTILKEIEAIKESVAEQELEMD